MEVIKYKKGFMDNLRRMKKTNQVSGKIVKKKKRYRRVLVNPREYWEKSDLWWHACVYMGWRYKTGLETTF